MKNAKYDCTFVTYSGLPDLDPDDLLAFTILQKRGYRCQAAIWDDPRIDWSTAGLCIIRSTWDYHLKLAQFSSWLERLATTTAVQNHPDLVRWSMHKSYLRHLAAVGVATVPTIWLKRGSDCRLDIEMSGQGWSKAVIKPAVGLATSGVKVVSYQDVGAGEQHARRLLADGDLMLQPYIESVKSYGERALVFIKGEYSHAVRKTAFQALLPAGQAGETFVEAQPEELETARQTLRLLPAAYRNAGAADSGALDAVAFENPPLYARVDLVRDNEDRPIVIELELVEPSLFLSLYPPAATTLANGIERLLTTKAVLVAQAGMAGGSAAAPSTLAAEIAASCSEQAGTANQP